MLIADDFAGNFLSKIGHFGIITGVLPVECKIYQNVDLYSSCFATVKMIIIDLDPKIVRMRIVQIL